jgi:hypothetical protein
MLPLVPRIPAVSAGSGSDRLLLTPVLSLLNGLAHGFWVYFVDKSITFWATLCRFVPVWAKMCHFGPLWATLCSFVPLCALLCRNVPLWATLCSFVPVCALLCRFVPSWAKKFAILAERFIDPLLFISMGYSYLQNVATTGETNRFILSKSCKKFKKLRKVAKFYGKLRKVAKFYGKLRKVAQCAVVARSRKKRQNLRKVARNLRKVAESYKVARSRITISKADADCPVQPKPQTPPATAKNTRHSKEHRPSQPHPRNKPAAADSNTPRRSHKRHSYHVPTNTACPNRRHH